MIKHISNGGTVYYLPGECPFREGDYVMIESDIILGGMTGVVYTVKGDMVTLHIEHWGEVDFHYSKLKKV